MIPLVAIFFLVFVVGPLVFFAFIRPVPTRRQFRGLIAITAGCLGLGLALRFGSNAWGRDPVQTFASMSMMWAAWIAILALVVQRFRAADSGAVMRRWTAIMGAICTTIPWFGLASARFMTV
ncbi:MAG: hypothetical protein ACI9PY_000038 [Ascidiaceihabitans sp.]|jgi:hypothetical protein